VARDRKVVFARINRRRGVQDALSMRSFAEDMQTLAASHRTRHYERGTRERPARTWFAADMRATPGGEFMMGTLGYSERQQHREFDAQTWSWLKGATQEADAASEQTVVPFAVDIRDDQRWVAFAPAPRLQPGGFRRGLELVLRQAVADAKVLGAEWDVDLVTSRASIEQWLEEHPRVFKLQRTVKFSNPGRDLDDDRTEMRALAARRKFEEFAAPPNRTLDTTSDTFVAKLDGTETGDLELVMTARGEHGVREVRFNSRERADEDLVEDFVDLEQGMEVVLAALREYVASKQRSSRDDQAGGGIA
jgi:hypothetical protein